ncbi:hypothetical protein J4E85_009552 [Alternaria conjuncta]|uniref:uncharacterized protein n=1 Tax=Alternaria conjuncta TaxID=181017 RepID=UPI00221FC367|nr:uncharacterized protein J4E85_009552 [Alternaria conjuncta]KAI4919293.1 hypothetical protein J4E85_009552 [Alternaria conjuncta]
MGAPLKDRDTFLEQGIETNVLYVVLFHIPQPEFVHGDRRAADTLDQTTDHNEASDFVCRLFHTTKILRDYKQIFDSDIKEQINAALADIGERYNHKFGLLIKDEHMAGVIDIAREMVKMHFKVLETAVVGETYVAQEFLPKMDEAVGWNHARGFGW